MKFRILLDTNVLIPLQDSHRSLTPNLTNFHRLVNKGGHELVYAPASEQDIRRDKDADRRATTLQRLQLYTRLDGLAEPGEDFSDLRVNDRCDAEILWALQCEAAHVLVTEDNGLHKRAKAHQLDGRVFTIQTAEDWLKRLHESADVELPNIATEPLHSLVPQLHTAFFDSLRSGYDGFDGWFRQKARDGRQAWVYRGDDETLGALCIFAIQNDEEVAAGIRLAERSLKLCTFKVGENVRGQKIGELFLKAAFRYASENRCEHVFLTTSSDQTYLIDLLEDFGFKNVGRYQTDIAYVKEHPATPPKSDNLPLNYVRQYFPHFRADEAAQKFIVPVRPEYHERLFPDWAAAYRRQAELFPAPREALGNAIKLAYLCHAQSRTLRAGDVLMFYRSIDDKALTTIGIVEHFEATNDAERIALLVRRRTVYSYEQINEMANRETVVILFRCVGHFKKPIAYETLSTDFQIAGPFQSIRKVDDDVAEKLLSTCWQHGPPADPAKILGSDL